MKKEINILELASELAHERLVFYAASLTEEKYKKEFPNEIQKCENGDCVYTEEAQDVFNEYYDSYLTTIDSI